MWEFILVFILTLCLLQYFLYHTKSAKIFNKIPGPPQYPVIGNFFHFVKDAVPLFYCLRRLASLHKNIYKIQVFHMRMLNILNPYDAEILLSSSKHITKSIIYTFLHSWLNEGLLTSNAEKWHKRRKILTPAFHFNILQEFCVIFNEQSKKLVTNLKTEVENEKTNIIPYITKFTLNSICETAMGTQLDSEENSSKEITYKNAIHKIVEHYIHRLVRIWLYPKILFEFSSTYRIQNKIICILHNFTTSVIKKRRKTFLVESSHNIANGIENNEFALNPKKRMAMLDLLLSAEAEGKIDEKGIREEVDTFMFEGHDTTAMGICFSLMLLANNKKIQDRVVDELDEIFLGSDKPASMTDLNNMKYLEMCLKEALRIYPSVPFISREIKEDVQFTNYLAPAGTVCHIHIFDIHRDPSLYPSPEEFIPERFTQENCSKRHPFAYIPFSAGPRNCIGQRFALYEEKSVISSILRNYILEPVTTPLDMVFACDLVMRTKGPIYIKFLTRK